MTRTGIQEETHSVHFLGLVSNLGGLLALDVALLELRKETAPVLICKLGVLSQFSLDHEFLLKSNQHTEPTR
jgi:hypothetical protein